MSNKFTKYSQSRNIQTRKGYEIAPDERHLISYIELSKLLGILGIALPVILLGLTAANHSKILPSISDYYYSISKGVFIGIISAISVFLYTYNGFDDTEKYLSKIAGIAALLLGIFPTSVREDNLLKPCKFYTIDDFSKFVIPSVQNSKFVGSFHLFSAFIFFAVLVIMILWKFIAYERNSSLRSSNRICLYLICGIVMALCILIMGVNHFIPCMFKDSDDWTFPLTFTCEAIALLFFGIAWITRGKGFMSDRT